MLDWARLDRDKVERSGSSSSAPCGATSIDGSGGDLGQGAAAADGSEVLADFASLDDTGVFLTRLVDDPGPPYQRIVDLI